ncbi:UDP-3-O-(3-hydroxymyristoyl)glucosamine N-acyltransferase [Luteolibacter sp. LG18]|uniref:UDP-3-O-(3-hydroxymyristoyl)glucosamine N-acyltransferase n=1 Tax=Luteolibacter sp. LG18 TaxID=2819286 RepID=UPI0030C66292
MADLVDQLSATLLSGSDASIIQGFASLREAGPGDLSFFNDARYKPLLHTTRATAVLVPPGMAELPRNVACLEVQNPSIAFEAITDQYGLQPQPFEPTIHDSAVIGSCVSTNLAKIKVGAHAVIEDEVHLGDGAEIGAGCFVGRGASIGAGCRLFANSTVHEGCVLGSGVLIHSGAVIGADGFGYAFQDGRHRKIRQSGVVQLDDDVEIGAGTTVDRARFGRTWIGEGTKIDNQVQIGHNVVIGKHCIIVAGSGIAGSSQIGDYVVLAAQVGVAGHVSIGSHCTITARTAVTKSLPANSGSYMGFPAAPAAEERRRIVAFRRLPELFERVKKLERGSQS